MRRSFINSIFPPNVIHLGIVLVLVSSGSETLALSSVDLSGALVLIREGDLPPGERAAAETLVEEFESRTGIALQTATSWPGAPRAVIAIASGPEVKIGGREVVRRTGDGLPENKPEGYRIWIESADTSAPVVWILGADGAGALFGVGHLLRKLVWSEGAAAIPADLDVATFPAYPIRGHQLGYRNRANSWDAWSPEQFEQHIRELAIFGTNAIENIPFQDDTESPHMVVTREEMNVALGKICAKYDMQYWVWTPAEFPLTNSASREALLAKHEAFYKACPRLDAVFFPGGDPGDNPPDLIMPYLEDVSALLKKHHPKAGVWLSLQNFEPEEVRYVYKYLQDNQPDWFTGVVGGPSSPPLQELRANVPKKYPLRQYPDITHTVRCQYPVKWWDPAYALTLGREPINPQPVYYAAIVNWFSPYTDGFISYSDGANDDVNKVIWSMRGYDPNLPVREILLDYTRFFFGPQVAEPAADGILALEENWEGSLAHNGSVDATFSHWRWLEERAPALRNNWRWVSLVFRAFYDVYTRHRSIYESKLEDEANAVLAAAPEVGADRAMKAALSVLGRADEYTQNSKTRSRIFELGGLLFDLIRFQFSIERHRASGAERGAVLDFIDYPLNNRWWLEDRFAAIGKLESEEDKLKELELIRTWEHPGLGSFYDDVGNIAKSDHVVRGEELNTDILMERNPNPGYWWWDSGMSRRRLSWQVSMDFPAEMKYEGLDPEGKYLLRMTGQSDSLLRVDGDRVEPTLYSKEIGEFKEFPVPKKALEDGKIGLTWDRPDEAHLNWRQQSHIAEVWLLKQ